jgi:serine/threonine protein kinase/WD40 repeat protein
MTGFRAGSLMAGYRLEAPVGAGGMAVVFRARDERLGRLVALKILTPAVAADPGFRRRFIAESRAAAAVDDPHIIPVYEAGEADGVLFIAMRLVRGGDLRLTLEREGALTSGRAVAFISPVASALDAAHAAGLVHRDVKPANILVDARTGRPDHVYLSDFGVSKGAMASVSVTEAGQFLGTPDYAAPEQIDGRTVDGRADQYALACVSYQLLTGAPPFERDRGMAVLLAHLSQSPPSLASRRPGLPGAADRVLGRALAKAPEERYGSCQDFAEALREALGVEPYISGGSAIVSGYPYSEGGSEPGFLGASLAETAKADVPGGLEAAATIDSVPGGGSPGPDTHPRTVSPTVGVEEDDIPAAGADGPARSMDGIPADQSVRDHHSSGSGAEPAGRPRRTIAWIRRHRLASAGLTGTILAVAIVVPYLLASSPGPVGSPRSAGSSGSVGSPRSAGSPVRRRGTLVDLPSRDVTSLAFSSNGVTLAVGGNDGRTYLWNITAGKLTGTLTDPGSKGVNSVAFSGSHDRPILATADSNGRAYLWNTATRKLVGTLTDPGSEGIVSVAFIPGSDYLITADRNSHVYVWDITTRKLAGTSNLTGNGGAAVPLSIIVSPNGNTESTSVASSDNVDIGALYTNTTITLTDPGTGANVATAYSPDSTTLASGNSNGSTYLWNIANGNTGTLTATLTDPLSAGVNSVAYGPTNTTLATGDNNGSTYVWDTATKKITAILADPGNAGVTQLAFTPNGTTLATGDANGDTYLWHLN